MRIPYGISHRVDAARRGRVFHKAMKSFRRDWRAMINPDHPVLGDLIYGWGNENWSAKKDYLSATIAYAAETPDAILECGSGLTTLLVGTIAHFTGRAYWALEHSPVWAQKLRRHLRRYGLTSVNLHVRPLRDYGEYCWYDPPLSFGDAQFSLVICDGPPGDVKGGRYGLVPVMASRLQPAAVILLDDARREQEQRIAERWRRELRAEVESAGSAKPYFRVTLPTREAI